MTNSNNLIETLEIYVLNNPDEVSPHWVSHFIVPTANELLIKIKTICHTLHLCPMPYKAVDRVCQHRQS